MFNLALLLGIYGYLILLLGFLSLLNRDNILVLTISSIFVFIYINRKNLRFSFNLNKLKEKGLFFNLLLAIITITAVVNLLGALAPELAFDALWYHLTLPKLYLLNHSFYFIPGGTLYYSTMPQLTEMYYLSALALNGEISAKVIHFLFGLGICFSIFKISRKYLNENLAMLAVVIFYANLVVAWESTTAYIDLARTFFEVMAFWSLLNWEETREKKWFYSSAIIAGLAISTKILSFATLGILLTLIAIFLRKEKARIVVKHMLRYFLTAFIIPVPFFIHSFLYRGNPFYPIFSKELQAQVQTQLPSINPLTFFSSIWNVLTNAADPISPIYIIIIPLIFFVFKKFSSSEKLIVIFSFLSLIAWYITPQEGGGRFMLPYLPVMSVLVAVTINKLKAYKHIYKVLIGVVIFLSLITIGYRGVANKRYLNVVLGRETKEEFLAKHLEFDAGNFADIDGYFKDNIKRNDKVLLYGFHNLYYVNFPFIDASWVKEGDKFNYIAVKESILPDRFKNWNLIYENKLSGVKLYLNNREFFTYFPE